MDQKILQFEYEEISIWVYWYVKKKEKVFHQVYMFTSLNIDLCPNVRSNARIDHIASTIQVTKWVFIFKDEWVILVA